MIVKFLCHFELRVLGPSRATISDGNEAGNAIQVSKIYIFALLLLPYGFQPSHSTAFYLRSGAGQGRSCTCTHTPHHVQGERQDPG
jgi:hypothetical protein